MPNDEKPRGSKRRHVMSSEFRKYRRTNIAEMRPYKEADEADKLMAEMADTIEMLRACCTDMGADGEAAHTLHLYNQYKGQAYD